MKVLIHACPERMWYVEGFLKPELLAQGADDVAIWNDTEKKGNLLACMESFAARSGTAGTWHIQDDVLPCSDFVQRCREMDDGVVYGFCNEQFTDDPRQTGTVYIEDAWHSFQCVRIPDEYARECAEWFYSEEWKKSASAELPVLHKLNKGDDSFFREFLLMKHGTETVINAKPNLAEHVDWIIGGSVLHPWRGYLARAFYWDDEQLVDELKAKVRGKVEYKFLLTFS